MKKIVRISEEQLTTLINRVVVEQDNIDEGILTQLQILQLVLKVPKGVMGMIILHM